MFHELRNHSPAIVAAIREAFTGARACHCQGDGKLSENELLEALVHMHAVRGGDFYDPELFSIKLIRDFSWSASRALADRVWAEK